MRPTDSANAGRSVRRGCVAAVKNKCRPMLVGGPVHGVRQAGLGVLLFVVVQGPVKARGFVHAGSMTPGAPFVNVGGGRIVCVCRRRLGVVVSLIWMTTR